VVALETGCVVERSMGVGPEDTGNGVWEVDTMDLGWRASCLEIGDRRSCGDGTGNGVCASVGCHRLRGGTHLCGTWNGNGGYGDD